MNNKSEMLAVGINDFSIIANIDLDAYVIACEISSYITITSMFVILYSLQIAIFPPKRVFFNIE